MIRVLLCAALLSGCARLPEVYAPPEQRHFDPDPNASGLVVAMNANDVFVHAGHDIDHTLHGGAWRWTLQQPTVSILIEKGEPLDYSIDFALWDGAMKQTGPVELAFLVNGNVLAKQRYDAPGQKHFERAVPAAWLHPGIENEAAAKIDKLFADPGGERYGFILTRIGFVETAR